MDDSTLKSDFAREILGPILFAACHRLWLHHVAVARENPLALFSARGGLRILDLYRRFLAKQHLSEPVPCAPFMISRLAVAIAAWHRAPAIVVSNILSEFHNKSWDILGPALIPDTVDNRIHDKVHQLTDLIRCEKINELIFYQVVNNNSQYAMALSDHVSSQEKLFNQYLHDLTKDRKHLLLCDTGLFASSQLMLMAGWPEYQWYGLYLGRSNYRRKLAPHFSHASGLILEIDRFSTRHPETALLNHWHLLEMPLEPDIPSVTHYFKTNGMIQCNSEIPGWEDRVTARDNPYYKGIVDYFENISRPLDPSVLYRCYRDALYLLQRIICMPNRKDIRVLKVENRQADFGQKKQVPILRTGAQSLADKLLAIRSALWKEGQIRVEFHFIGGLINYTIFQFKRLPYLSQFSSMVLRNILKLLHPK